jgi:hypothetical protein
MLTVMSDLDPHMISGIWDGFWLIGFVGFVEVGFFRLWVGHCETLWCDQDRYFEEMRLLSIY